MDEANDVIKHLFTPHHTNNHRPRILHPEMLVAVILVLFTIHTGVRMTARSYPGVLGYATNITVQDLLSHTNQERISEEKSTLQLNDQLSRAAEKKALDMFANDYWAHTSPNGTTPWDFINAEGYPYVYAGENLARDFSDSKGVVDAWMKSASHRDNLLRGDYQEIGFAVVNGELNGRETTLVVQMFGTPRSGQAQVTAEPEPATTKEEPATSEPEQEEGQAVPIAQIEPSPVISPVVDPVVANEAIVQSGSFARPVVDQGSMQRNISFLIIGGLMVVLAIDGVLILRRRTVRIAGHNFAHLLFFAAMVGIILISSRGTIL